MRAVQDEWKITDETLTHQMLDVANASDISLSQVVPYSAVDCLLSAATRVKEDKLTLIRDTLELRLMNHNQFVPRQSKI